ncbi:DNA/RNA non-specific endonuclease [Undibacterium squillarum]|uniref:Endonuclease n=1 Tax=Undibacterium squillarum TaxID=1131567 RepID=A0ABQ2XXW0_9BURK|nr:DNA/RNA non-specific endonuclease [Undibacterium squillarum]GGX41479.1 hypothetical protein GCM10010946_19990 [Undibacterium squillarum]
MLKRLTLALALLLSTTLSFAADFSNCREFFAKGEPPVIQDPAPLKTRALCFSEFAVMHSGRSRTPLYVAERINRSTLSDGKDLERTNRFYADARLPRSERAELDDYKGSGYDRGHMAPAANRYSPEGMAQSFSLANMVPQNQENNRKTWAGIEKSARKYASRATGDVYIISGPVFPAQPQTIGSNKVWVPHILYKLIYDPATNKAWAYWVENTEDAKAGKPITYQELVQRTGIRFLPTLNPAAVSGGAPD